MRTPQPDGNSPPRRGLPCDNIFAREERRHHLFSYINTARLSTYYITTAIDYPNAQPHLGHALEKIGADTAARYRRLKGYEVFFSTGVDENSLNVAKTALAAGKEPLEFVDEMSPHFHRTVG